MERKKAKQYKDASKFIGAIRQGIDANLQVKENEFIMFVGGILSKLVGRQQYVYINGRGWVAI